MCALGLLDEIFPQPVLIEYKSKSCMKKTNSPHSNDNHGDGSSELELIFTKPTCMACASERAVTPPHVETAVPLRTRAR
jgi:hypothetical protein